MFNLFIGLMVGAILTGIVAWIFINKEKHTAQERIKKECENAELRLINEHKNELASVKERHLQEKSSLQTELTKTKEELRLKEEYTKEELQKCDTWLKEAKSKYDELERKQQEDNERLKEEAKQERVELEKKLKQEYEHQTATSKAEREEQLKQQMDMLRQEFQNASDKILKDRQHEFKLSSTQSIDAVLKPLREQISKMSDDMLTNKGSQEKLEEAMEKQIKLLLEQTKLTADSANNLTMALIGNNKTQGDYGERLLVNMLKEIGFSEETQILSQEYIKDIYGRKVKNENGATMRPDIILKTDRNHVVVIDSKMVLKAYKEYIDASQNSDEQAMAAAKEANTNAVLNQVELLAKQNYVQYIQRPYETVEYTLMYVPMAGALRLAMTDHPGLWHEAMRKKILIVDEFTLGAMLKVIEITWSKIEQTENMQKIVNTASLIIERVEELLEQVVDAETAIQKASTALGKGHALLVDKSRSIVTAANTLQNLGVRPKTREYAKRLKKAAAIHEELGENMLEEAAYEEIQDNDLTEPQYV